MVRFRDRSEAGQRLADRLLEHFEIGDLVRPLVLALPRGGLPVAFEVARRLHAPLEVFVARKVGAPGHSEYGIGAVAEGGSVVADPELLRALGMGRHRFEQLVEKEREEIDRRVRSYRGDRALPDLPGRDVVLVDDGLATGVTAQAALLDLRTRHPGRLILTAPVCPPDTAERLARIADEVVFDLVPTDFVAVGRWYRHFDQVTDAEVNDLLTRAATFRDKP